MSALGRTRQRSEHGAAAVEFALVVPFLCLILFGIISYGYMLSFRQSLSQGAAEGARAAAVAPSTYTTAQKTTAAINAVNQALGSYGVSCSGTSMKRNGVTTGTCAIAIAACTNNGSKQCVTVSLDYLYKDHSPIPTFPGLGVTLPSHLGYAAVAEVS